MASNLTRFTALSDRASKRRAAVCEQRAQTFTSRPSGRPRPVESCSILRPLQIGFAVVRHRCQVRVRFLVLFGASHRISMGRLEARMSSVLLGTVWCGVQGCTARLAGYEGRHGFPDSGFLPWVHDEVDGVACYLVQGYPHGREWG